MSMSCDYDFAIEEIEELQMANRASTIPAHGTAFGNKVLTAEEYKTYDHVMRYIDKYKKAKQMLEEYNKQLQIRVQNMGRYKEDAEKREKELKKNLDMMKESYKFFQEKFDNSAKVWREEMIPALDKMARTFEEQIRDSNIDNEEKEQLEQIYQDITHKSMDDYLIVTGGEDHKTIQVAKDKINEKLIKLDSLPNHTMKDRVRRDLQSLSQICDKQDTSYQKPTIDKDEFIALKLECEELRNEKENQTKLTSELQEENKNLKEENDRLQAEQGQMQKKLQHTETRLRSLENKSFELPEKTQKDKIITQLTGTVKQLEEDLEETQNSFNKADRENTSLKEDVKRLSNENITLKEENEKKKHFEERSIEVLKGNTLLRDENDTIKKKNNSKLKEIHMLKKRENEDHKRIVKFQEKIDKLEEEIKTLNQANGNYIAEEVPVNTSVIEAGSLEEASSISIGDEELSFEIVSNRPAQEPSLAAEPEEQCSSDISEQLQQQIDELIKENEELKMQVDELRNLRDEALKTHDDSLTENDEAMENLNIIVAGKDETIHHLKNVLAERDEAIESLNKDLTEKENNIEHLQFEQRLNQKKCFDEREEFETELERVKAELSHKKQNEEDSNGKLVRINTDRKKAYDRVAELVEKNDEKEKENETLRLSYDQITEERAKIFSSYQEIQYKIKEREAKVSQLEGEIQAHQMQSTVFQSDFQAEREAREKQAGELIYYKDELNKALAKIQHYKDEARRAGEANFENIRNRHAQGGFNTANQQFSSQQFNPYDQGHRPRSGFQSQYDGQPGRTNYANYGRQPHHPHHGQGSNPNSMRSNAADVASRNCPKCNGLFPDLDTLEIHLMDCLENEN